MSAQPAFDARLSFTVGDSGRAFSVEAELSLASGVLVLFGPSGAGKTLTLMAIAGLERVTSGHVRIGEETLLDTARGVDVPAHERRIGYVPQSPALFPFLDVAANVAFGLPKDERRAGRPRELLQDLGITHLATARPDSLSGGEKQRVALARALAVSPRLLLLDEPFASVDDAGSAALRQLVREVIERHRVPAILVTHDVDDALALGDRVVRFARGKTVEAGAPPALLASSEVVVRGKIVGAETQPGGGARARLLDATVEASAASLGDGSVILRAKLARGDVE